MKVNLKVVGIQQYEEKNSFQKYDVVGPISGR